MGRPVLRKTLLSLAAATGALFNAGCLGGGSSSSGVQASLGSVEFSATEVITYDATNATLKIKGRLNVTGITDFNQIVLYSSATCDSGEIGRGIHQDFVGSGIQIVVPSTAVTSIYLTTNTVKDCFHLHDYLPKFDAPAAPVLISTTPPSPSRVSFEPYVVGTVSNVTSNVRLYSDAACSTLIGSGTSNIFQNTGIRITLQADATNRIYAMALDAFGKTSACTEIGTYVHSTTGPPVPAFASITPVSPSGASLTPVIVGTVSNDAQSVSIYSDSACSNLIATGSAADFRTTGLQVTATANNSISYYSTATDGNMIVSDCAFLTIYTHDSVLPGAPIFVSTNPPSPTRTTLVPRIIGTASGDSQTVKLYSNSVCSTQIGAGSKALFEGAGIPTAISPNEISTIYAAGVDAAGNMSGCALMTSFVHDNLPPDPPVYAGSVPASPNNQSITPRIQGTTALTTEIVRIYRDDTCSTLIGTGTNLDFEGTGIQVSVVGNTTTALYGTALDEAGNISDCSALGTYAHSTVPAIAPGFFITVPSSPTRLTNTPYIVGTAHNTITRVTLYSDNLCIANLGSATRSVFITSGIQATVAMNSQTTIYAMSEDVYGNTSACTTLTSFIHNTVLPLNPIFVSVTPLSPNAITAEPVIRGSITFDPGNILPVSDVALYDSFLCLNRIGQGTPAAFQGAGLTAAVTANAATDVYIRSFDAAGNMSACTFMTNYVHDTLIPGRPILSAISPATPSYTSDTHMTGIVGPTTDFLPPVSIVVYSDSSCSTQVTSSIPSSFTNGTLAVSVAKNATTQLYGAVFNVVGTSSPCTSLVNYVHSDVGPSGLSPMMNPDGSVVLNWNPDTLARPTPVYEIRRSLQSGGPYTTIGENIMGATYTDTGVTNGETYYYVVAARNNTGVTKNSAEVSIMVNVSIPGGPLGLSAAPGANAITLNWGGNVDTMTFKLMRGSQSGGPYTTVADNLTSTTYLDTPLLNDTRYYYVVVATNPAGVSLHSNEAEAVPLSPSSAPTNLTVVPVLRAPACGNAPGAILSWSSKSHYSNFVVSRSTVPGSGTPLQTTSSNTLTDCAPTYNGGGTTSYNYYTVTASWGFQSSGDSNQVVFANESPGSLSARGGNNHVSLSWNSVTNAVRYQILRSLTAGGPYTVLDGNVTSTTYYDATAVNGTAYFYVMQAEYPNGAVGWPTLEQSAIPDVNPGSPTGIVLTVNASNQPVLTWSPPSHYNSFRIYRSSAPGGPFSAYSSSPSAIFTDTSPIVGMNYYRVTTVWGTFESAPSSVVSVRNGFPSTFTVTAASTSLNLSWSAVAGATEYNILRGTQIGGPYSLLTTVTTTTHVDTTTLANEGYFYVIQAVFADLTTGQYSAVASGTTTSSLTPGGLTVTATTSSSIALQWARVTGASSYKVFRATSAGGTYTLVSQGSSTSATITGLAASTNYFFKYTVIKSGFESGYSAIVSARTYASPSAPIVTAGNSQVSLAWGAVTDVSTYTIERSTDGANFTSVVTGLTSPLHVDNTVVNGTLYFYRVVAVFPATTRESAISPSVTPGITPRPPAGLTITANTTGTDLEISWGKVAGVSLYRLYQATVSGGPYTLVYQTSADTGNLVTSLVSGTNYYFVATSMLGSIESTPSAEIRAIPLASPNSPTAVVNLANIDLTWSAVSGAATYRVLRSTDRTSYSQIATGIAVTSYSDTTAVSGITYTYQYVPVTAASVTLPVSQPSAPITFGIQPLAPAGLIASATGTTSILLRWIAVPNASDYLVYRATAPGGPYSYVATTASVNYDNTGLVAGQSYYYVVSSRNVSGVISNYSNEATVRLVAVPTGLVANSIVNSIQLSWNAVGGATSYEVRRGERTGGPYGLIASGIGTTSYQDVAITNGITYFYVVTATVSSSTSPYSNESSAVALRAINLQVPIELVDQSLSSDVAPITYERTRTSMNTNHYDGTVAYEFEINARNSDGSAQTVSLVDNAGTSVASITVPGNTFDSTRMKAVFTPTTGANTYRVRLPASTMAGQIEVLTARVLVNQTNATRTRIYIPLLSSSSGSFIGDEAGPVANTISTTYDDMNSALIYRREASKYAALASQNPWELETLVGASGTAVGAVALYNVNLASHVDDTEAMFDGSSVQMSRSPFQEGVTGFSSSNEGQEFRVALRCVQDCQNGQVHLYKAGLWVTLHSLDKAQIIYRTSLGLNAPSNLVTETERTMFELAKYSNPIFYFQATGTVMGMDPVTIALGTVGTLDTGYSGISMIGNSDVTFMSSSKTRMRSSAILPTNTHRVLPTVTIGGSGSSLMQITDTSVIIDVTR